VLELRGFSVPMPMPMPMPMPTAAGPSAPRTVGWNGAVVMVTGASRGIGRAVAVAAAAQGARIGLVARDDTALRRVLDEIGGRGVVAVADVASRPQCEAAVAQVEAALGPIDIVVCNAGVGRYGAFFETDPDDFERLFAVNVLGTLYVLRAVLPSMVERRRGHVVVVGSVAGRMGAPFEALYSGTKFAQVGVAEALAVELSAFGIGVSIVNPGVVDTDFFEARGHGYDRDFPKLVPPDKVARALVRAVERGRLETFVPGWLQIAGALRQLVPPLYRWGTRRSFKRELAALEGGR
jgi:short-subunit dehydrogenase